MYLSYNGAKYSGWQIQPNGLTVQQVLEDAMSLLLRKDGRISITGAGRTDAKVHARMMAAHFDTIEDNLDTCRFADRLNAILPNDIAIHSIERVNDEAHARFDAVSRMYRYYVITRKDPFRVETHYRMRGDLDIERVNRCADILFEYEDFTSFSKLHTDVKTNNCKIMYARWEKRGNEYIFTIKADRFLRNMVRAIVGTLLDVGKGKLDEEGFRRIIEAKNRCDAGGSVPGHALFLEGVEYDARIKFNED